MLISGLHPPDPQTATKRRLLRPAVWMAGSLTVLAVAGLAVFLFGERGYLGQRLAHQIRLQMTRREFNRLYSRPNPPFLQQPNEFLTRTASSLQKGAALVVACGQGRNAVYLAQEGWDVTAFDISDKGLEIARRTAQRDGVPLNAIQADALTFDYGTDRWDLLLLVYAPIPYDDAGLLKRIKASVKPGGHVLVEMPIEMHQPPERHPRIPGDLLPGELPELFRDFEIVSYSEALDISDFYGERKLIGRLLARRR
ncbi:MAG: class I SAM-dependent methyltransferase [Bryobacteraceae bacterium]